MPTDDYGLSDLSDDQIMELFRAILAELNQRNPAVREAVKSAGLDAAEEAKLRERAAEQAAAAARAKARQRVSEEAKREAEAAENHKGIARARQDAEAKAERERGWMLRLADICGEKPSAISVWGVPGKHGGRIVINLGMDRFSREHLIDFECKTDLVIAHKPAAFRKPDIVEICKEIVAYLPGTSVMSLQLCGQDFDWTKGAANG